MKRPPVRKRGTLRPILRLEARGKSTSSTQGFGARGSGFSMPGRRSRDKGARTERAIVKAFQDGGMAAERVPLSGAAGGRFSSDITVPVLGRDVKGEVKCRAEGFRELYKWLGVENYGLVIKADRLRPLMVLDLAEFAHLARLSEEDRLLCERFGVDAS